MICVGKASKLIIPRNSCLFTDHYFILDFFLPCLGYTLKSVLYSTSGQYGLFTGEIVGMKRSDFVDSIYPVKEQFCDQDINTTKEIFGL
jgi:hypothetical protein